jgi:hypothetical protein
MKKVLVYFSLKVRIIWSMVGGKLILVLGVSLHKSKKFGSLVQGMSLARGGLLSLRQFFLN